MESPRCPVHGHMTYVMAMDWWQCPGWDGEGCVTRVTAEDLYRKEDNA